MRHAGNWMSQEPRSALRHIHLELLFFHLFLGRLIHLVLLVFVFGVALPLEVLVE